jgi:hypothetical protein
MQNANPENGNSVSLSTLSPHETPIAFMRQKLPRLLHKQSFQNSFRYTSILSKIENGHAFFPPNLNAYVIRISSISLEHPVFHAY